MDAISGGAAIVEAIAGHGIECVFGLPGAQTYPLFDALHGAAGRIRTIVTRHEQGAAYMAFGYARSTGRASVFSVVPGPGILNAGAALCTALGCNAPVLCLTGQVPSAYLGRGRGHLHELPDQLATLRGIVKERFPEAHIVGVEPRKPLLARLSERGSAAGLGAGGSASSLLDALEQRALWSRFGL